MDTSTMIDLIESSAEVRGDPKIPRDFITEALEKIASGEEEVERYPMGGPSMKGVYRIAHRLYSESTT